jgi:hypothetical protein
MAPRLHRYSLEIAFLAISLIGAFLVIGTAVAHDAPSTDFPLARPDLSWEPEPFVPINDPDARYIDYASGRDSNPGTRDQPWQHHPWDRQASALAATSRRISTYYFKKGVTYYGSLEAYESGTAEKPIRLTIDPDWGAGRATLAGSKTVSGEWHRCDVDERKLLPRESRDLTWCIDTDLGRAPLGLWVDDEASQTALTLARTPNWRISNPNDPRSEWNEIKQVSLIDSQPKGVKVYHLTDPEGLADRSPSSYRGATLWIEAQRAPIPVGMFVLDHLPDQSALTVKFKLAGRVPVAKSRYFLEGLPQFLDRPGEYAYQQLQRGGFRLYLRLPDDRNPNSDRIEAAAHLKLLTIKDRHHIEISGIHLRSSNQLTADSEDALEAPLHASAVQIRGSSTNIRVHHCSFEQLPAGIIAYPSDDGRRDVLDYLSVTDSRFSHIDGSAIAFSNGHRRKKFAAPGSRLIHVDILRNNFHDIGLLSLGQRGAMGGAGNAILVHGGETVEIAHNHVNTVGGPGVQLELGSAYSAGNVDRPFLRGLVHHNKVVDSLLASYDFGGISIWTGGPVYVYNNISGNPVGYLNTKDHLGSAPKTLHGSSYGIGIYLDGVYKGYVFNNVVWGLSNDLSKRIYNAAAFNEATGFMHTVFHNTFYRFAAGLHRGGGVQHNRDYYLGNLIIDMSHKFIQHNVKLDGIEHDTLAFKNNVFQGEPTSFGQLGKGDPSLDNLTFSRWQEILAENYALAHETGIITKSETVINAGQHDFRPPADSAAGGKGVKVFVPWALSRVVGEWHFLKTEKQPAMVLGENINMNAEWIERRMFHEIPRNDLTCPYTKSENFTGGVLENWLPGALAFDGRSQYCVLPDKLLKGGYSWEIQHYKQSGSGETASSARDTVDIHNENFIIEMVLSADAVEGAGGILNKRSVSGYELLIDDQGRLNVTLETVDAKSTIASSGPVDDGEWHHILIEANRKIPNGINIFVDGVLSNGDWSGPSSIAGSLANNSDFEVGRSSGNAYFLGRIDFLRIAKGTLRDAETTLEELREWQFNGPFLKGFSGLSAEPHRRNAGAVEETVD